MKKITQLNKTKCPKAFDAIKSRFQKDIERGWECAKNGYTVFGGLIWEHTLNGEIWHVAPNYSGEPYTNNWTDSAFKL